MNFGSMLRAHMVSQRNMVFEPMAVATAFGDPNPVKNGPYVSVIGHLSQAEPAHGLLHGHFHILNLHTGEVICDLSSVRLPQESAPLIHMDLDSLVDLRQGDGGKGVELLVEYELSVESPGEAGLDPETSLGDADSVVRISRKPPTTVPVPEWFSDLVEYVGWRTKKRPLVLADLAPLLQSHASKFPASGVSLLDARLDWQNLVARYEFHTPVGVILFKALHSSDLHSLSMIKCWDALRDVVSSASASELVATPGVAEALLRHHGPLVIEKALRHGPNADVESEDHETCSPR